MKQTIHLTAEEVIEIQQRLVDYFGGQQGLRDRGLLESALYRPQSGYYPTIFEQAAALLESLLKNHAFLDGNKRVAWTATKTFLRANGLYLRTSPDEAEHFIVQEIIQNAVELLKIAEWLEANCTKST